MIFLDFNKKKGGGGGNVLLSWARTQLLYCNHIEMNDNNSENINRYDCSHES